MGELLICQQKNYRTLYPLFSGAYRKQSTMHSKIPKNITAKPKKIALIIRRPITVSRFNLESNRRVQEISILDCIFDFFVPKTAIYRFDINIVAAHRVKEDYLIIVENLYVQSGLKDVLMLPGDENYLKTLIYAAWKTNSNNMT